ncbi:WD repeat-containing protein 44-like [Hibiscus syriacus]|uniref:WD repeat-containing protein 44-like n=1 Tax=Hibiscus syriacus TaxID=106335 RepID=UPI00192171CB|nr:WD repeat-containing protein 44-like [Hibiscus syriacus]
MNTRRMDRKKTMTMNWDGLRDDDDEFFEPTRDLASENSDDENEEFDDCHVAFTSMAPPVTMEQPTVAPMATPAATQAAPDYNIWMASPGSIKARRQKLFQGMGLNSNKQLLSLKRIVSNKPPIKSVPVPAPAPAPDPASIKITSRAPPSSEAPASVKTTAQAPEKSRPLTSVKTTAPTSEPEKTTNEDSSKQELPHSPVSFLLVRSRSEGEIDSRSVEKQRKHEMLGTVSKQRLTRTYSLISTPSAKSYVLGKLKVSSPRKPENNRAGHRQSASLNSIASKRAYESFFLIKNLDTGKEFIVNEYDQDGMWNKLSDLQTGKKLTMAEFDKCVGYSPVVKELMRRANDNKPNYISKSLKTSMSKGASMLKSITNSMALRGEKEREVVLALEQSQKNNNAKIGTGTGNNQWVKVRQAGKSYKELSALHLCQEIQAHDGSIWAIKFSTDSRYLASAGEDSVIHVWEVQECEVMNEGGLTPGSSPIHPSQQKPPPNKNSQIPDYVHKPEVVFSLSDRPICSFNGHTEDVLDLSWSKSQQLLSSSMDKTVRLWDLETKSCIKVFAHSDYVTCIHFNPVDDDHFISGSLDAKIRIWNVPDRRVVDWTDVNEMVTAACYTPDGQGAFIGSHKGNCRLYSTEECKLTQKELINVQTKKANAKKITGFLFCPTNPAQVLVTSADSRIRILEGSEVIYRISGFRNTSSQIAASFTPDGKYVLTASEDSQVFFWRYDEPKSTSTGTGKRTVVNARGTEQFPCKAVSVAIPWTGTIKGEPPSMGGSQSKRNSRRTQSCDIPPINEDSIQPNKKGLPPLPNKKNNDGEKTTAPSEEEPSETSNAEPGISEESSSKLGSSSIRKGDSPSMSSSSIQAGDPASNSSPVPAKLEVSNSLPAVPSIWSWFDVVGGGAAGPTEATAWGVVIVAATLDGEIKVYQNFGLPRKIALI